MDRPKHRRLTLLALVLLAPAGLLLLGRQWTSEPERIVIKAELPRKQSVEPKPDKLEPSALQATAPSAPAPAPAPVSGPATGFRGRVIDAVTRQPLQAFEVQLTPIRHRGFGTDYLEPIKRTFQSKSGRFAWSDVAPGTWQAAVSAPGHQTFNAPEFRIEAGKATREVVMPLLRGYAVRGRIFDVSTGAGIVDAGIGFRVLGDQEYGFRSRAWAKSKDDGSFTLDGVPGGDVLLTVGAQDHAYREVAVAVDEKTPPQEIALSAGSTISGIVTTTSGAPIKGRVWLSGPVAGYDGASNEAGQFSFKHMPPGRYRVSADTSAGGAQQDFVLQQDELKEGIVLVVGAGRSVRGSVTGPRPEKIPNTHLMLRAKSGKASMSSRPDERGAYVFNGVPSGPAEIHVSAYDLGVQFTKQVDVPADQDLTFDIALPTGARLSGRVTQAGKPAANTAVWMGPVDTKADILYRATTSEDGEYEIEGLPPGDYRLRAAEDISRAITIAGDAVLNIDIPAVQLSARVLEDGGSIPIVGADVYVRGSAPETARVRGDKKTDDFGQFALTGIEPGEVVLIVYKPGYEMYREKFAYSSPVTNKTIALRKSDGVEVHAKSGSRRFPIGFTITLSFPGNDYLVDIWVPLDRERVGHVPSALAGTTFQIGRFSGQPLVFEDWDGQPFELP
jgi:protocatechuate 3,4-dioxygenase beta subunit